MQIEQGGPVNVRSLPLDQVRVSLGLQHFLTAMWEEGGCWALAIS